MSLVEPEEIHILPITEEHIESYHRCFDSVARERLYLGRVEAPPLEDTRESVRSNIAGRGAQLVALYQGEVIGWCVIIPNSCEGFKHNGKLGMGVYKSYRRVGLGERLARVAIDQARKMGLERLELGVFASNVGAVKLYEKLGFEIEGLNKRARKLDGKYDDLIEMVLFI